MLAALTCFLRHTNALEISVEDISHRKSQGQNCAVQNFVHIIYLYILILIYFQSKIISMFIYISRGRHQHVVICTNANVPELLEILLTKSAAEFAEEGSWSKDSWLKRLLGIRTFSKDPGCSPVSETKYALKI